MTGRRPHAWATAVVRAATRLLPPGEVRDRYELELTGELWGMSTGRQAAHALATLAAAPALHRALVETGALAFPHSRLWCRLHLGHHWHVVSAEDGARFRRCRACGLDDDGLWLPHSESGIGVLVRGPSQ